MPCVICDQEHWQSIYSDLLKCRNCGFIRANNKYYGIDSSKLYDPSYFSGLDYENYALEVTALQKNFKDRLNKIIRHKSHGHLLEIGCAFGYFLQIASKNFRTYGVDLNHQITKLAKRNSPDSQIFTGDLTKIRFKKEFFDVICMFDTIEHLKNPGAYLTKVYALLKPGGIIVIETGDIGSWLARIQGDKWRLITPPTHLNYFSGVTLDRILVKNKFRIIEKSYVPFYRTMRQTIFRITRIDIPSWFSKLIFSVNTYDLLFVIARKQR